MPRRTKVETWTGEEVSVEIDDGREYRKRIELSLEDYRLLFGVERERGEPVADFLAAYDDDALVGVGEDAPQPEWAEAALSQLDITEVRV